MSALRAALWVLALHVESRGWTADTRMALEDCWARCAVLIAERV